MDAFTLNWGEEHLAYIFAGPEYPAGRIIAKIQHDRSNCILVVPRWHKHWRGMLAGPHVRDFVDLGFHDGLLVPGPLLPPHKRSLRVPLLAYRIDFTNM